MTDSKEPDHLAEVMAEDVDHRTNKWPCWDCKKPVSMRDRAENDGDCPHCGVELDIEDWPVAGEPKLSAMVELRQQLADVSNERDVLRLQLETMTADRDAEKIMKARARGHRSVFREQRDSLQLRLNASEARNAALGSDLKRSYELLNLMYWHNPREPNEADCDEIENKINLMLAQSEPATDEQGAV